MDGGFKIPRPREIDLELFSPKNEGSGAFYGLPMKVQFCSMCGISNQKPNIVIEHAHGTDTIKPSMVMDENLICAACQYVKYEKPKIDWKTREEELGTLCTKFRSKNRTYDCIVPGSGGKDSMYVSHLLKTRFGMNPLTVTWASNIPTEWGKLNYESWISNGFENLMFSSAKKVRRLLARLAVENLFHPLQPFEIGVRAFPPKIAINRGIPLVFYGESSREHGVAEKNISSKVYEKHFSIESIESVKLAGLPISVLREDFEINQEDLEPYLPIDSNLVINTGLEVHNFDYFIPWNPLDNLKYAKSKCGFYPSPERSNGSFTNYSSIEDKLDDLNWYARHIKFGLGRASYDAATEVRYSNLKLQEARRLVAQFDGEFPSRFMSEILSFLSLTENDFPNISSFFESPLMDESYLRTLADNFRSPHLWSFYHNKWFLRQPAHV